MEWVTRANCRGRDPEQFFVRGAVAARQVVRICASCPVRQQCLEYALDNGIEHGIWGGLTERQRRVVARRMAGKAA